MTNPSPTLPTHLTHILQIRTQILTLFLHHPWIQVHDVVQDAPLALLLLRPKKMLPLIFLTRLIYQNDH